MKNIPITCKSDKLLPISQLENFQGKLKAIDEQSFNKLKESIVKYGFSFPIFVWGKKILDGHQRLAAVKRLIDDGYSIKGDKLPIVDIIAKSEQEAAEKLLLINSRYARIDQSGFDQFVTDFEIDLSGFSGLLEIPEIDFDLNFNSDTEDNNDEMSDVAPRKFNDDRDNMTMQELLNSVDLVKISFSGGKDSVATALTVHHFFGIPKDKMLLEHYFNPFEWDDIEDYCQYFSTEFGVKLVTLGKDGAIDYMYEKISTHGLPTVHQKWCFEKYKQRVFGKTARLYRKDGINYIQAVGIRAAESSRRAKMLDRGIVRDVQPFCHPIFDMTDEQVFKLPIKYGIKLHHAYKFFSRTGCPVCPMCPPKEFLILRKHYPDTWEKGIKLFIKALSSEMYRNLNSGQAAIDIGRMMGIGAERSKKEDWIPPDGLEFWSKK